MSGKEPLQEPPSTGQGEGSILSSYPLYSSSRKFNTDNDQMETEYNVPQGKCVQPGKTATKQVSFQSYGARGS